MKAKGSSDALGEKNRNHLFTFAINGGFCTSNLASTDNFTLEQEDEELGTNMAAPVGAPSYITFPSLPLISTTDVNDTLRRVIDGNPIRSLISRKLK